MWVGVKLCVANGEMAQYMHRMMLKHVIAPKIGSRMTGLSRPLGTTAYNPLKYLKTLLYAEPVIPEECITQLLAYDKQHRGELKSLLMEYKEAFPTELPKRVPPNRGLGDKMEIKLVPGIEPIW